MSSLQSYQNTVGPGIIIALEQILANAKHPISLKEKHTLFQKSMFGGKMFRSLLVCLGYQLSGKKHTVDQKVFQVAAAFEVLHTALIIHDDIMDQSETRRGNVAFHKQVSPGHTGESLGICFGDLGIVWAIRILQEQTKKFKTSNYAVSYFLRNLEDTIIGQTLDIHLSNTLKKELFDIFTIHTFKTAKYSFVSPLGVGAILSGCSKTNLQLIEEFGTDLGIAFQIQDDILGVFGDEQLTGKSASSDIKEGKNTCLICNAIENASQKERGILNTLYGNQNISAPECELVRDIFIKTGALQHSQRLAQNYLHSALKKVDSITTVKNYQLILSEFAQAMVERNK